MNMMPVMNILIINHGRRDTRKPMAPFHHVKEFVFEFFRVAVNDSVRVLTEDLHLPLVALAHTVALESVLVSTLFLTHLTVPSEFLKTFRFDSIRDCFRCEEIVLTHFLGFDKLNWNWNWN